MNRRALPGHPQERKPRGGDIADDRVLLVGQDEIVDLLSQIRQPTGCQGAVHGLQAPAKLLAAGLEPRIVITRWSMAVKILTDLRLVGFGHVEGVRVQVFNRFGSVG